MIKKDFYIEQEQFDKMVTDSFGYESFTINHTNHTSNSIKITISYEEDDILSYDQRIMKRVAKLIENKDYQSAYGLLMERVNDR